MQITRVYASTYSAHATLVRDDGATFTVERTKEGRLTVGREWRSGNSTEERPAEAGDVVACLNVVGAADLTGWTLTTSQHGCHLAPPAVPDTLVHDWQPGTTELPF